MNTTETIGVQPVHLKGARGIGEAFGVKRDTVAEWARLGAPVIIIGGRYQADYHSLWDWLIKNSRKPDKMSVSPG